MSAGIAAAALLLPAFLFIEARAEDPMVRLSTFRNRTFAFGNLSALLNSVARFAVMFMFVFFFIGVRGYDHLMAGLLLIPLARVMFATASVSRWLSGRGEARVISIIGMLITTAGLLGVGTLVGAGTPYWEIALLMSVVGAGSGIFTSPNTRSIMSSVGPGQRGVASGTRTLLTNVGGVLSIAVAISIVAGAIPQQEMFEIFSGTTGHPLSAGETRPFIVGFHRALLLGAAASLVGAVFSALRGRSGGR